LLPTRAQAAVAARAARGKTRILPCGVPEAGKAGNSSGQWGEIGGWLRANCAGTPADSWRFECSTEAILFTRLTLQPNDLKGI
jgi:hypothetical protein